MEALFIESTFGGTAISLCRKSDQPGRRFLKSWSWRAAQCSTEGSGMPWGASIVTDRYRLPLPNKIFVPIFLVRWCRFRWYIP